MRTTVRRWGQRAMRGTAPGPEPGTVQPMIGHLSGTAIAADIIDVAGVGYLVHTATPLVVDQVVSVWVHTAVRENDISLYGFDTLEDRELFLAVTRVSGVGPKMGLALLALGTAQLAGALLAGDAKALAKAPGIGIRKAEAILLAVNLPAEFLRGLVGKDAPVDPQAELTAALVAMGHDESRARAAVTAAAEASPDAPAPAILRAALQALNQPAVRSAG